VELAFYRVVLLVTVKSLNRGTGFARDLVCFDSKIPIDTISFQSHCNTQHVEVSVLAACSNLKERRKTT
jgi:hypothetical protein